MEKLEDLELFNDDCFNVFDKIDEKSVNLFVLDLPYNQTACNWDNDIIPLEKMWDNIKRIMKPKGIVIMFCTAKFGYKLIHSNPKWFRYDLIWKKSRKVGFLSANKMPLRQHENIYLFSNNHITYCKNGKYGTYNPQKTEGKPYKIKGGKSKNINGSLSRGREIFSKEYENKGDRYPSSLIEHYGDSILTYKNPHKTIHRTQKPVELCEWLIKTYSNEGDTVMDFTMGSATVGIACLNTNRKFIGVEKDKQIYEKAETRIMEHLDI
tara:strand:+ start:140 stop:937 length:798 start_codon:yes stop_codon:yes gene_type:complete